MTGYEPEEFIGRTPVEMGLIDPKDFTELEKYFMKHGKFKMQYPQNCFFKKNSLDCRCRIQNEHISYGE